MPSRSEDLPAGWRWVRLGDAGEIVSGVTLGRKVGEQPVRVVPYLRVANVKDGHLDLGEVYEIEATRDEIEKLRLCRGDLLLTEGGDPDKLGRGTLWGEELPECIHQNHIFRVRLEVTRVFPEFVSFLIASPHGKAYFLSHAKRTTGIATINQKVLAGFPLMVPPIAEQRCIAAVLKEQMVAVERARAAAEARLEAAKALPAAQIRAALMGSAWKGWSRTRLGEVCELLPSKSIATDGDTQVQAITTACLTESGFAPSGVKQARMWKDHAAECVVRPGEILVARSNTPELVGRAAVFLGEPSGAVATDLTIRIWPKEGLVPGFLVAHLSCLYLTGYWKSRAGGASGSMKKITREQIQAEQIPVPPLEDQKRIVCDIRERLRESRRVREAAEAELAAINALPAALFQRTFSGAL